MCAVPHGTGLASYDEVALVSAVGRSLRFLSSTLPTGSGECRSQRSTGKGRDAGRTGPVSACTPSNSIRSESLYSSNHRWRHCRESGKSKGCGRFESRPIPKQAFAGSNPVTRSSSQLQAHPASDWRPDGSRVTCLIVKNTQDPVPLLRTFTSLSPNLGRDGPPGDLESCGKVT